mmetsp:Transcript_74660/g.205851  ORF Transcript_74660/g.205851 Transcript_74660/m.205851 type:complete len:272 (-) Transcript_74660:52-867(-)
MEGNDGHRASGVVGFREADAAHRRNGGYVGGELRGQPAAEACTAREAHAPDALHVYVDALRDLAQDDPRVGHVVGERVRRSLGVPADAHLAPQAAEHHHGYRASVCQERVALVDRVHPHICTRRVYPERHRHPGVVVLRHVQDVGALGQEAEGVRGPARAWRNGEAVQAAVVGLRHDGEVLAEGLHVQLVRRQIAYDPAVQGLEVHQPPRAAPRLVAFAQVGRAAGSFFVVRRVQPRAGGLGLQLVERLREIGADHEGAARALAPLPEELG